MGSDLSMEANSFRPRANRAEWVDDELVIYEDRFYHGYQEVWRGPVTDSNRSLILTFIKEIPKKSGPDVNVTITFTDAEYQRLKNNALWRGGSDVGYYIKGLALGNTYRGC